MKKIISFILGCMFSVSVLAQQDSAGNYINSCENFGALAVAVVYVREEEIFTLTELVQHQHEYFKKSGLSDQEIVDLILMISYVYLNQLKVSDAEIFEAYGESCLRSRQNKSNKN